MIIFFGRIVKLTRMISTHAAPAHDEARMMLSANWRTWDFRLALRIKARKKRRGESWSLTAVQANPLLG